MIVVTGSAGFIGSCLVTKLNQEGLNNIFLVDDFSDPEKNRNLQNKLFLEKIHRDLFPEWLEQNHSQISMVFHIGARTDTTEFDERIFEALNLNYSKRLWNTCSKFQIPFIYASSAATYGDGNLGYDDDPSLIPLLKPLNPYGVSKNEFDKWVLQQKEHPPLWFGLKFFNVFGPNEFHKGRMASVIFHSYHQILNSIKETGQASVRLFRSHNPGYKDGEQVRDFIYVKDVVDVLHFLMKQKSGSGIYNLGTGKARTFLDLAGTVFAAMNKKPDIQFIDTPVDIRDKYQYFTEAKMNRLNALGYSKPFTSLENGIEDYITCHLADTIYF